jgi:hypothetical protein
MLPAQHMHLELKIKIALKKGYLKYDISVLLKCKSKHIFWRLFKLEIETCT